MRKISKLIALVLAIAVVLCPMLSTVASAEAGDLPYSFSYNEETGIATVSFVGESNFLVSLFKLQLENFELAEDEDTDAVTVQSIKENLYGDSLSTDEYKADYWFDAESGILSVLVSAKDAENLQLLSEVSFDVALTCTNAAECKVGLVGVQAATSGYDFDTGLFGDEALIAVTGTDIATGLITEETLAANPELTYIASCDHAWVLDEEASTAADCDTDGLNVLNCANGCGETKTEFVEALGHDFSEDYVAVEPTCGDEGLLYVAYGCSRCDAVADEYATQPIDPTGEHAWDEGQVTTEPTYEAAGVKTYTCTVCGDTKTDEIPALQHEVADVWSTDEENHWKECSCGAAHDLAAHADEDTNGACDVCGYEMEVDCEHANATKKLINVTETQFIYLYSCSDCDAEDWEVPVSIAAQPYTGSIGLGRTLDPQNDISILYYFNKAQTDAANVTELVLVATKEVYAQNAATPTISPIYITDYTSGTFPNVSGERYFFKLSDIAAYEMNNAIESKLYGLNANGEMVLLKTMNTYSVYTYAKNTLASTGDAKLKTLLVDMLNYGAAAQSYTKRNAANLVNANPEMTADILALGTPASEYPALRSDCFEWTNTATSYPNAEWVSADIGNSRALIPSEKVDIVYALTRYKAGTDLNNYYCSFTYYDIKGNLVSEPYVVKYDGSTYLGYPSFVFNKAPLAVLDYPVTATFYYGDPNNGGVAVMECQYSVETYIARNVENADLGELMKTMYAYGHTLSDYCGVTPGSEKFAG